MEKSLPQRRRDTEENIDVKESFVELRASAVNRCLKFSY